MIVNIFLIAKYFKKGRSLNSVIKKKRKERNSKNFIFFIEIFV